MENVAAVPIPDDVVKRVQGHFDAIDDELRPYITPLTAEERKRRLKMGDGNEPLVNKVVEYTGTAPQLAPFYMSIPDLKVDADNIKVLGPLQQRADQTAANINDTLMVCGGEAMQQSLMYYNGVKQAAETGVAGARPIYDDLKKRFPGRPRVAAKAKNPIPLEQ
ncbi:MAG: hypothetical protein JWP69_1264 [Flaviaesturariibacter sp.]|nr:hypothetical protein [Flaviaesturariibacter sp.]